MTETKTVHSFPALEITSFEMVLMKIVGAALTAISVLAGYGVASLSVIGTDKTPPEWIIVLVAVAIMATFFTLRIRMTVRQEAALKAMRNYVCQDVRDELVIDEEELRRAIEGETVVTAIGDTVSVVRDGDEMKILLHPSAEKP